MKQRHPSEKQFFDEYYAKKPKAYEDHPLLAKQAELYFSKMRQTLQPKKTDLLLSLGCAEGRFEIRFASKIKEIVGIDVSEKAISQAKKKAKELKIKNVSFYSCDITNKLPFKDSSFDGVLVLGIFHHLEWQKLTPLLFEIKRVLKPNGFIYSIDPNAKGILRIVANNFFQKKYQSFRSPNEYDVDYQKLIALCQKNGFELKKIEFLDFCLSEFVNLWPSLPKVFFVPIYILDRIWCHLPILNKTSSQFSLYCKKRS